MTHDLRFVPYGGALVEVTYRTIQGRYLLRPSRKVNDIVVGSLARAQRYYPRVDLHGISVLSNHLHMLVRVDHQQDLSSFAGYFAGNAARKLNQLHGWSGKLWHRRYCAIPVTAEPEAQIERLEYLLAQGVKEHLVERVADWPGVHCGKALLEGRSRLTGTWIDGTRRTRLHQAGKNPRPEDYTEALTVELRALPCWAHLHWSEYVRRVRAIVERIELRAAEERRQGGIAVLGADAIRARDPETRPEDIETRPAPRVHAATRQARKAWRDAYAWFVACYREAADTLKKGDRNARFPEGCFPPGLPFVPFSRDGPGRASPEGVPWPVGLAVT